MPPANLADTVKLAYRVYAPLKHVKESRNSPLIIMHGLFGSKSNWQSLSKAFASELDRSVYVLDARNHGDSPHNKSHTYPVMAQDVKRFILDHGLNQPIVIGHSMGAKTGMALALQYPDLVKMLVSVDNAPVHAYLSSDFHRYVRAMKGIETRNITTHSEADQILQAEEKDVSVRHFLLTNLVRDPKTNNLVFRIPLDILANSLDYLGDFPFMPEQVRYEKPALFVRGKYSRYVTDEMMPIIGRFFPRFQIEDVEAGHWIQAEKPIEFKNIVKKFIQDEEEFLHEQSCSAA